MYAVISGTKYFYVKLSWIGCCAFASSKSFLDFVDLTFSDIVFIVIVSVLLLPLFQKFKLYIREKVCLGRVLVSPQ